MGDLKLRILFAGIDRVSGMLGGISAASQRSGRALHETNRRLQEQQRELRDVQRQMERGSGNLTELINRERALTEQIERGNRELTERQARFDRLSAANRRFQNTQAAGDKMIGMGGRAVAAGAAIGAGAAYGVKSAMDMEEAMAGVAKVTNMGSKEIALLQSDILEMTTQIPMAAEGLANIAAAAGSAGVGSGMKDQANQLKVFTKDAAEMGIAFDMSAEDAGTTMAKWRTAFGFGQDEVRALGDQVNAMTNKWGGSSVAVTDILTRIGPLGKIAGIAAPQIAAIGQLLNSAGVESEVAATGIKNMMLTLNRGKSATKGQRESFKALGLDAQQVATGMQKNAGKTIIDVLQRIGKVRPDKRAAVLSELFGTESVGAIAPMLNNLDGLRARFGLVADKTQYAGSMHKEFLTRIATTKGAVGLAMNGLTAINIQLGQKLLPYVVLAAQKVLAFSTSMTAWAKANPEAAGWIAKIAAGLAGLLVSLGGFGVAAGFAIKAWGFVRLGAMGIVGPIKAIPKLFGFVSTAAKFLASGLGKAGSFLIRYLPMAFGAIRTAALFMARGVVQAGAMMLANPMILAAVAIGAAIAGLAYLVYTNWDSIKAAFFSAKEAVGSAMSQLGAKLSGAWQSIKGAISSGLAMLRGLLPGFRNIGAMMLEGLLTMLSPARLAQRVWNLGKVAIATFKRVLGIHSPSRVFAGLGGYMMEGLEGGIDAGQHRPVDRINSVAKRLTTAMAVGAVSPALAMGAPGVTAGKGGGPAGAASGAPITIHVHGAPGQNEQLLAEAVAREVAKAMGQQRATQFASFADTPDWENG